jgi:hypothetical protein
MSRFRLGWRHFRDDLRETIPPELTFAIATLALAIALLVATGFRVGV